MPRSPNVDESKTDVDIHIRRMLDPHTAADFFAAMEPKSWFDKILDWIKETAIGKWSRRIFKKELSALLGSLAGKFIYEFE